MFIWSLGEAAKREQIIIDRKKRAREAALARLRELKLQVQQAWAQAGRAGRGMTADFMGMMSAVDFAEFRSLNLSLRSLGGGPKKSKTRRRKASDQRRGRCGTTRDRCCCCGKEGGAGGAGGGNGDEESKPWWWYADDEEGGGDVFVAMENPLHGSRSLGGGENFGRSTKQLSPQSKPESPALPPSPSVPVPVPVPVSVPVSDSKNIVSNIGMSEEKNKTQKEKGGFTGSLETHPAGMEIKDVTTSRERRGFSVTDNPLQVLDNPLYMRTKSGSKRLQRNATAPAVPTAMPEVHATPEVQDTLPPQHHWEQLPPDEAEVCNWEEEVEPVEPVEKDEEEEGEEEKTHTETHLNPIVDVVQPPLTPVALATPTVVFDDSEPPTAAPILVATEKIGGGGGRGRGSGSGGSGSGKTPTAMRPGISSEQTDFLQIARARLRGIIRSAEGGDDEEVCENDATGRREAAARRAHYNTLGKGSRGEWVEVNDADGTLLGDAYQGTTMYVKGGWGGWGVGRHVES
jgi:hypothetical protein